MAFGSIDKDGDVISSYSQMARLQTDLFKSWMGAATMMAEAQAVIGFRVLGMAGLWAVAPSENDRMVSEKAPAFAAAMRGGTLAAMSGKSAAQILDATVRPLGRKTRANSRRLARRGPRLLK